MKLDIKLLRSLITDVIYALQTGSPDLEQYIALNRFLDELEDECINS